MSSSDTHFPWTRSDFIFSGDSPPLLPYTFHPLLDHIYAPPLPQRAVVQVAPTQPPSQVEIPSSESSSSTRQHALPLDEYLDLESDTSDEEMEEVSANDPSTTTAASAPAPRPERVPCLWQGCCAGFEVGTHYDVWKDHIRSAHTEQENESGNRSSRATECQWDGCGKRFRQSQGVIKHMATHLHAIRRPCPLGCGKSFRAEQFTISRHLRCCPLRETSSTRG